MQNCPAAGTLSLEQKKAKGAELRRALGPAGRCGISALAEQEARKGNDVNLLYIPEAT